MMFQTWAPSKGIPSPWLPSSNLKQEIILSDISAREKGLKIQQIFWVHILFTCHQPYFYVYISFILSAEWYISSCLPYVEGFPQDGVHLLLGHVWGVLGHPVGHPPWAPLRSFKCKTLPPLLPRSCASPPLHAWQSWGTVLFCRGENYWRPHLGLLYWRWEGG